MKMKLRSLKFELNVKLRQTTK